MLTIHRLTKTYQHHRVLHDLSFAVPAGEIYGLLGPNGAGKTTTINILCHVLQADSGRVEINGRQVSERTLRWIGVAPQETLLYRNLTCQENLRFFASLYGLRGKQRDQRVQDCLAAVKLTDRARLIVDRLSGGMQRRLNLAIALVHQPKLLILDEPTTGLDLEARYDMWELIRSLQQQGMTILLTTHLLDETERLCQRIGILQNGRLLAEGTLAELHARIPAQAIVIVQTREEDRAIARATELGFPVRRYGPDLAFWLPQPLELAEILTRFEGIPLDSVARQAVRLEHVYLEVLRTQG